MIDIDVQRSEATQEVLSLIHLPVSSVDFESQEQPAVVRWLLPTLSSTKYANRRFPTKIGSWIES